MIAAIETTAVSDGMLLGDLEHSLIKEKKIGLHVFLLIFMFCYSRFRFSNLKDAYSCMFSWCITTSSLSICPWHDMAPSSLYSKCTVFTINLCYLEVLAICKKVLSWTNSIMDKSVFLYWWLSFDLQYYLILGSTNNVLHFSVTNVFVHSVESGTSEKVLQ